MSSSSSTITHHSWIFHMHQGLQSSKANVFKLSFHIHCLSEPILPLRIFGKVYVVLSPAESFMFNIVFVAVSPVHRLLFPLTCLTLRDQGSTLSITSSSKTSWDFCFHSSRWPVSLLFSLSHCLNTLLCQTGSNMCSMHGTCRFNYLKGMCKTGANLHQVQCIK